ncbi:Cmx/CmrA family chloramphenicol efflux MFS transporter, partial [Jiangella rhizosphaerae]
LAGAYATAAMNVGAAGPWLAGAALAAGAGYRSPLGVSAALVAAAIVVAGLHQAISARSVRAAG